MINIGRKPPFWAAALASLWMAACGGGGGGGNNNNPPPNNKTTPTVAISAQSISAIQSLTVTVTVSGSNGTPTGSVTLSSGNYTSSATTLSGGSASISVPPGSLPAGTDTLSAAYTPDSGSSSNYFSATGTSAVTITTAIPTVTVTPASQSITVTQSLTVSIAVSGGVSGAPTATGSVTLSGGSYTSGATALSNGGASITIPVGKLAVGSYTLTAAYTPDTAGATIYQSASGTTSSQVAVTVATPTVTVTPASQSITAAQSLNVTITVSGGADAPPATGSVTLSGGTYTSSATTLSNGSASITIPAGKLAVGSYALTAAYTPDTAGGAFYKSTSGTTTSPVSVTLATPTVTVTPETSSITANSPLSVTITVSGGTGALTATGSVGLSSGTYTSSSATLSNGSVSITIPANTLTTGTDTLSATYTPDSNSANIYKSAQGTGTVTVGAAPVITSFTANPTAIVAGSSTGAQLTAVFSGGTGVITPGNISVTSGTPLTVNPTATTTYTLTVTPPIGSAITQTVTLTVDPSVSVCTTPSCSGAQISGDLLGVNLAEWYDDITNASSILSAFQTAGITAVRWPGGSNSDEYHWATNSGCNDLYASPNDTFANFESDIIKAGSLDLAVTANYGSNPSCNGGGDPSEAAAWAGQAVTDGNPIHYMTVGNEDYGSWEYDLHAIQHDPATYASAVSGSTGYYDLIKAQSPSTQVGVIVDADCTTSNDCTDGWDSTVLQNAADYYDFVEFHYYPQYGTITSDTFLVQQAAQEFTSEINTIKSELQTAGKPNTPIYVGEIGANSSNPGTQSWSITQGLYAAQILGEAMNDGVTRLTWWIGFGNCLGAGNNSSSLYGWQNTWGSYNVFSDGSTDYSPTCPGDGPIGTMSPTGEAFNLFQNVAVKGEYPQTTAVVDSTGYTRAYAATHSGGYALVLFNLNQTAAETVSVAIGGMTSSSDVKMTTYDKEIYDYTNVNCQADQPTCTYDPTHNYSTSVWSLPVTTDLGPQSQLPLTITLQPWSMNVVIVQP
jgi:hypothetical protein